jgi:hypothetical protein
MMKLHGISRMLTPPFDDDQSILISDIVMIDVTTSDSDPYPFKEGTHFEIKFHIDNSIYVDTHKNVTCVGLASSRWQSSCQINVSALAVSCLCNRLGTFAVLASKEISTIQPVELPESLNQYAYYSI